MKIALQSFVALAFGISVGALVLPSQAEAIKGPAWDSRDGISSARALAVHECSVRADSKYPTWVYGVENIESYSACMAEYVRRK